MQLGPDLDLYRAAELTPYLSELGVSHIYTSPFLQADPGAGHGYAVVDPNRVDENLGGEEGRRRLTERAREEGLGIVVDLVPNHMAVSLPHNQWFWEVLEHGPSSRYAGHFDVDWDPAESATRNQVLLPILADHYGREVEAGAIQVRHRAGRFTIAYHDQVMPASPRSVSHI
ncbi:MAG: alpha-amylase family glycosyl hydrolase, partial [Acidimicrobiia bacterium]